jgi:hypothetical protein
MMNAVAGAAAVGADQFGMRQAPDHCLSSLLDLAGGCRKTFCGRRRANAPRGNLSICAISAINGDNGPTRVVLSTCPPAAQDRGDGKVVHARIVRRQLFPTCPRTLGAQIVYDSFLLTQPLPLHEKIWYAVDVSLKILF